MGLFNKNRQKQKQKQEDALKSERPRDTLLKEELNELSSQGDQRELTKADTEVKEVVTEATRTDLRNILLIDQGRCPVCHARTENFLFTAVCPSCGWFRRNVPEKGESNVFLEDGEKIRCDYVHRGKDEYLCIRGGVVIAEITKKEVRKIDHVWEAEELEEAQLKARKTKEGICSWCEKSLKESEEDGPYEDYVAFGAFQERYTFCSEKCQRNFRRQYPSRIHRNCYERDCNTCDLCIKRYDTHGFKRNIIKT